MVLYLAVMQLNVVQGQALHPEDLHGQLSALRRCKQLASWWGLLCVWAEHEEADEHATVVLEYVGHSW